MSYTRYTDAFTVVLIYCCQVVKFVCSYPALLKVLTIEKRVELPQYNTQTQFNTNTQTRSIGYPSHQFGFRKEYGFAGGFGGSHSFNSYGSGGGGFAHQQDQQQYYQTQPQQQYIPQPQPPPPPPPTIVETHVPQPPRVVYEKRVVPKVLYEKRIVPEVIVEKKLIPQPDLIRKTIQPPAYSATFNKEVLPRRQ